MPNRRVWLVLPDPLTTKLFFTCGLVDALRERLGDRLEVVFLQPRLRAEGWADTSGLRVSYREDVIPDRVRLGERVRRRLDDWLERRIGFWPLAIRFNHRHGFHLERMAVGHGNPFLDLAHRDRLPRWRWLERLMLRWYFSPRRYVPSTLRRRMNDECDAVVVAGLHAPDLAQVLNAARRTRTTSIGYIASWDHAVGKGVLSSHLDAYIVQTDAMRDDLRVYHGVDPSRVVVTGWPQSDYFHAPRSLAEWEALLARYGLDASRPVVLVMGNTPTNTPYEPLFFQRLIAWWHESGADSRFSMLFRPHPRDNRWQERFQLAMGQPGLAVQPVEDLDIESLAVMLRFGACVVSNAGTILLDALVNDRPAVCVLYDEGAPPGERHAAKNVLGAHYRDLMSSTAFSRAESFDEVTAAIERALADPGELAEERARVAREVVGQLDGLAGARVADAVAARVGAA